MSYPELLYRWEWRLQASPEQLWPFVADTNRFNRDTGLPTVRAIGGILANARRRLGYTRFGVPFEWEEEPFEWLEPRRFGVRRRYRGGPIAALRVQVDLNPLPEGGTHLIYSSWLRPRSILGLLGAPIAMGVVTRRSFAAAFRAYDELARRPHLVAPVAPPRLAPGGEARLAAARRRLIEQGADAELVARLTEVVAHADDPSVAHLRPYALADAWGAPRQETLALCLWATRAGLLDLQWDLLCPLCRSAKASSSALAELTGKVHCATCNIDVTANLERSVELTFRPNEAIRSVESGSYCVAGPRVTPHVVAQQLLAAGERRSLPLALAAGRYRVRALGREGSQLLVADTEGQLEVAVTATAEGWPADEARVSLRPTLHFQNATDRELLFILERTEWSYQAATAAEVTTRQVFRDLFSRELVRPGESIGVGSLTILFTDLRDSTSFYRQVGDAPAFGRVLDHFAVLREEITREEGAVVKTIGDAVMAVFRRPHSALRATLRAQRRLARPAESGLPLHLKAGLHHGPCIAVTLNDRLDYFGSTVNLAARLDRFSSGADVIVSDAVLQDPEVAALVAADPPRLVAEEFAAQLKGFDDETFRLWRVHESEEATLEPAASPLERQEPEGSAGTSDQSSGERLGVGG